MPNHVKTRPGQFQIPREEDFTSYSSDDAGCDLATAPKPGEVNNGWYTVDSPLGSYYLSRGRDLHWGSERVLLPNNIPPEMRLMPAAFVGREYDPMMKDATFLRENSNIQHYWTGDCFAFEFGRLNPFYRGRIL